jgi:hypothetical protein
MIVSRFSIKLWRVANSARKGGPVTCQMSRPLLRFPLGAGPCRPCGPSPGIRHHRDRHPDLRVSGRYHADLGASLQLLIHAGRAIVGGTLRHRSTPTDLILPPSATTQPLQRASGAWELAAPTDPPPQRPPPWARSGSPPPT